MMGLALNYVETDRALWKVWCPAALHSSPGCHASGDPRAGRAIVLATEERASHHPKMQRKQILSGAMKVFRPLPALPQNFKKENIRILIEDKNIKRCIDMCQPLTFS